MRLVRLYNARPSAQCNASELAMELKDDIGTGLQQLRPWHWLLVSLTMSLVLLWYCFHVEGKGTVFMVSSHEAYTPERQQQMEREYARTGKTGLDFRECRVFGILVEAEHSWRGHRPTEYRGFPGGKWVFSMIPFALCAVGVLLWKLIRSLVHIVTLG